MDNFINNFDDYKNIKSEEDKLKLLQQKVDLINSFNQITNADGSPYFSVEWLKKNILGHEK